MNPNNYKAHSGEPIIGGVTNALAEIGRNDVSATMRNARSWGEEMEGTLNMGVKLSLSAVGMGRSLFVGGSKSGVDDPSGISGEPTQSASSQPFDRYDSDKDFYFRCGDYYMPLSLRFTLRAQKNLVESQLIDGAYIIERVSKAPKTIDVTIRLQRKVDEEPTALHIVNDENRYNPVADISSMIQDLYEKQDVFTVENPILNGELGVTHVIMREFSITPGEGTTLMTLQMSFTEIDIKANIINNEGSNSENGEILAGELPLIT